MPSAPAGSSSQNQPPADTQRRARPAPGRPLRWQVAASRALDRDGLVEALRLPPVAAQVLAGRGFAAPQEARRFLEAALEDLRRPDLIASMPSAADRIVHAVRAGEPITIYGDYDADGVTATSILWRGLSALGARPGFFIPSRFTEGYGLNRAALERIASQGTRLVVAVDCGITAVDEAAHAAALGMDLVIVDHHEPGPVLPAAVAVIDPKRLDVPSPFREYSAAGLAFQLLRAVRVRASRADLPDDLLDLAALGTIADVVPLLDDNRILARHGLARLAATDNIGLRALVRAVGLSGSVSAHHVAFSLAPRINAAGRLGDAAVAVRLLTTEDPAEADAIAQRLDDENRQRRALCDQILAEAVERVEQDGLQEAPAIVLSGDGWHAGVVGIVASQLVERYHRPVVLIAVDKGVGKGSARSIETFHMVSALGECAAVLDRFGGHAMAAGLTIAAEQLPEFSHHFIEVAQSRLQPDDLIPTLRIDAEVTLDEITESLARALAEMAPFGAGNPEPVLAVRGLRAVTTRVMSDGAHLGLGVTDGRSYAEAVGFRLGDASELLAFTRAQVDLAFTVGLDRWNDRERVQLVLRDLVTPGVDLEAVLTDSRLLIERLFNRAGDYLGDGALGLEDAGAFHTKVAGVTFEGRQALVQTLQPGQALMLAREPGNPHDPHAIKVLAPSGAQIGYLSARVAARLAPTMDSGTRYSARATQITGGGDRSYGVNIYLQREEGVADDPDPGQLLRAGWGGLPPDQLIERLRVHLYHGRSLRPVQLEVVQRVHGGEQVWAVLGPGRGRRSVAEMIAAAAAIAGRGPVLVVAATYRQVDQWYERLGAALGQIGVRCVRAHGALLFRQRQRLQNALQDGSADVILASYEYLMHAASSGRSVLRPTLMVLEADSSIDEVAIATVRDALGTPQLAVLAGETPGSVPWGMALIVDDVLRTALRLVDRRNATDPLAAPADLLVHDAKALIYVGTRAEAVEVAAQLRSLGSGQAAGAKAVAYYHGGLPLRVREVIEQMFADGKVQVLVVADALGEGAVPKDVRHVVIARLPLTRQELLDAAGSAGLDGRQAAAVLAYPRTDVAMRNAELAERNPPREALAAIYRAVRERVERDGSASWPDETFAVSLQGAVPSLRTVGIGVDILAEAGVIQREYDGERWRLTLGDGSRRELATSVRYAEGKREAAALAALTPFAFGPLAAILSALASPTTGAGSRESERGSSRGESRSP